MAHPANALQAAIFTRLTGYGALTTALGGSKIYDNVEQGTTAPYVVIGDDTLLEAGNKTSNGWECTITIHCWDFKVDGRKSVKTLMGHIWDALHRQESSIMVTGFTLVDLHCEFEETFQDTAAEGAKDKFYHGVQRFRAILSETTT